MNRLSDLALVRFEAALCHAAALEALHRLVELIDPDGSRDRWSLAGEISRRLQRFEAVAYARIARGHREPSGALEQLLFDLARCPAIPRGRRRLFDLLTDVDNGLTPE